MMRRFTQPGVLFIAQRMIARGFIALALLAPGPLAVRFCNADALADVPPAVGPDTQTIIDDFEDISGWAPHPADGVDLSIRSDDGFEGRCMRLDFSFTGGGYAVARKSFDLDLPENYAFSFHIRGEAPINHLEFKLIDDTGENVWWSVRRDMEFPREWEPLVIKKRHVRFAWGPLGGGEIRHVAAIEVVVTAGSGGTGSVWIDDLRLRELPPPDATPPPPIVTASSAKPEHDPRFALDGDPSTFWAPVPRDTLRRLRLDFQQTREYGGLVLRWIPRFHAGNYDIDISDDGSAWRTVREVRNANGGRDYLFLPESESRYLRLRILKLGEGATAFDQLAARAIERHHWALAEIDVEPLEWASSREVFFQNVAEDAPRGSFPRGISGEQSYWTVVGVDADPREVLINEDGMIETGKGRFSVEPFLHIDKLVTWADVELEQILDAGFLPIPSVTWRYGNLTLAITAIATGDPGASSVLVRYRLGNIGPAARSAVLLLALRPFQVNPPSQTLNAAGGTAPIRDIALEGRTVRVNGETGVVCLTHPERFHSNTFDELDGNVRQLEPSTFQELAGLSVRRPQVPPRKATTDPFGAATGILSYRLHVPPGGEREVDLLIPLYPRSSVPADEGDDTARAWVDWQLERARYQWRRRIEGVVIDLPEPGSRILETLESQLGYILVNRAGPAIQPGARSYARSWIRDGALTSSALLRLGKPEPVREFIEWYAPHQYGTGKIPCVVDHRGADPVPEHDSSGEFIFLIAEYYRYTRDRDLVKKMWPRIVRAVDYLDGLRREQRTDEYLDPGKREFYGILPPSISHEGYSAKPMHSYWDDLFALRGFKDAVYLAGVMGMGEERARFAAILDEFENDLGASVGAAMDRHEIDYIPGCADLGDFDPTSTTIALGPVNAGDVLPDSALERTFEKYYEFFTGRRDGEPWEAYTPYEIRNVGAFVRLGWRERARELLDFFFSYQYPAGWRQWAEVVWNDDRVPHFIGDLPHTWVGSDYIRSVLDMLAYDLENEEALVVGAGIPAEWLQSGDVKIRDLPTPYGPLTYEMALGDGGEIQMKIQGDLEVPPGGIVIRAPATKPIHRAKVNGEPVPLDAEGSVVVRELPASVVLAPGAPSSENPLDRRGGR